MRRAFGFALCVVFCVVVYGDEPLAPRFETAAYQPRAFADPVLRGSQTAAAAIATLPRVSEEDVAAVQQWNAGDRIPTRAGVVRPLATPMHVDSGAVTTAEVRSHWRWRGTIRVEEATRLRLQLTGVDVPAETVFWVYGDEGSARGFDISLLHEGVLWTPSVHASAITLDVEAPLGKQVAFDIAAVAEIFEPMTIAPNGNECLQDASCYSLGNLKKAIGLMAYIKGGQPYLCSGGLMNDRAFSGTPYFLTANHCISNATEAASLEVYWDYDTAYCGAPFPSKGSLARSLGSTLLVTSASTDMTLLRLNGTPGGRLYLGWNPNSVADGTRLRRISHPNGWPHAYSESIVTVLAQSCTGWGRPNFIYSYNAIGSSAGGSSGSPTFYGDGYVVGQLTGSCGSDVQNPCSLYANRVDGSLAMSWSLLKPYLDVVAPPPPPPPPPPQCVANSTTACLLNGRFRVTINYRNQFASPPKDGNFVTQRLNPSATNPDTAIFGFDSAQNVEVVVRIVDARPYAPRFDIYYGGLTDVEYWVNVTDVQTNKSKQYRNLPFVVGGGVDRATFPTQ